MTWRCRRKGENNLDTSYADCFRGTNLRRTIIAIGVQVLQQAQGNSFTTTYLVIFLKQAGVKEPLLINVAKMCCNFGATLLTFFLTDMLGRRPMLMGGSFFMAGLMWTVSGVSHGVQAAPSNTAAQGVVAAILLYVSEFISFSFFIQDKCVLTVLPGGIRCRMLGFCEVDCHK